MKEFVKNDKASSELNLISFFLLRRGFQLLSYYMLRFSFWLLEFLEKSIGNLTFYFVAILIRKELQNKI